MKKLILLLAITAFSPFVLISEAHIQKTEPTYRQITVKTINIVDAINDRLIAAEADGAGRISVKIKVRKLHKGKLTIEIPASTFFVNRGHAQDMIAIKKTVINLKNTKEKLLGVPAVCANFFKDIPDGTSKFDIIKEPSSEELMKLAKVIDKKRSNAVVNQVAIWIVTDNIQRIQLDDAMDKNINKAISVFNNLSNTKITSIPSDDDVIQAMQIVEEAEINLSDKIIHNEQISAVLALSSRKDISRNYAAKLLGIEERDRLALLAAFVRSDKPFLRNRAMISLVKIGEPAVNTLLELLNDANPDVQNWAVWGLGEVKDPRAVEQLIYMLKDNVEDIREVSAASLGKIGDKRAVISLIDALNDREIRVRQNAIIALGELQDRQAIMPLIKILNDNDPLIRQLAIFALVKIGKPAVRELINAFDNSDGEVQESIILTLGSIRDYRSVEILIDALTYGIPSTKETALWALMMTTGKKFGSDHHKWRMWWEARKKHIRKSDKRAIEIKEGLNPKVRREGLKE